MPFFIHGETMQRDIGKLSVSIPINGTMYGEGATIRAPRDKISTKGRYTSAQSYNAWPTHPPDISLVRTLEHAHVLQCDRFPQIHRLEDVTEPAEKGGVLVAFCNPGDHE
jgi:hypothetical protein